MHFYEGLDDFGTDFGDPLHFLAILSLPGAKKNGSKWPKNKAKKGQKWAKMGQKSVILG